MSRFFRFTFFLYSSLKILGQLHVFLSSNKIVHYCTHDRECETNQSPYHLPTSALIGPYNI